MLKRVQHDVWEKRALLFPSLQGDERVDLRVDLDYSPSSPDENQQNPCGRKSPMQFGDDRLTA
jgi:hypothetical protein